MKRLLGIMVAMFTMFALMFSGIIGGYAAEEACKYLGERRLARKKKEKDELSETVSED